MVAGMIAGVIWGGVELHGLNERYAPDPSTPVGSIPKFHYRNLSFTPDGENLVFDRHLLHQDESVIHILNLKTGELTYFQPPPNQIWWNARFSRSGKKVVFLSAPSKIIYGHEERKVRDQDKTSIVTMNADGSDVMTVLDTPGKRGYAAFSNAEDKIVFSQQGLGQYNERGTPTSFDMHLYELDIESKKITLLTPFGFWWISALHYMHGDRDVLLSGGEKGRPNSRVYTFKRGEKNPMPISANVGSASEPGLDNMGNIYFFADNSISQFSAGQKKSWPIKLGYQIERVISGDVSYDGALFAIFTQWYEESKVYYAGNTPRPKEHLLYLLDMKTGEWRRIDIPEMAKEKRN